MCIRDSPRNFPSNSKHLAQERAVQARLGPQTPSKDALCASPAPLRRTFVAGPLGYPPEAQKPLISKPRAPKKLQRVVTAETLPRHEKWRSSWNAKVNGRRIAAFTPGFNRLRGRFLQLLAVVLARNPWIARGFLNFKAIIAKTLF